MENFKDKKLDLSSTTVEIKEGKYYFVGEALTKDYECEDGLNVLAAKLVNKDFTWRHRHPIEEKHKENHVYGVVEDAWVEDKLKVRTKLYDHTEDHRTLIKDIQLRDLVKDPLSLSMHYRTYYNEKGEAIHYDVFELAGTPFPHCKECNILYGVKKMENEIKEEKVETKEDKEEAELEKALATIKEMEIKLNSNTKAFEDLKVRAEKLESQVSMKEKELEEKETKEKTFEERILELENYNKFLETKKPILDKLLEADPAIDKNQAEWLKTQESSYLQLRLEDAEKKAKSQIITKDVEESAKDAKLEAEKEKEEVEKVTYEQFMSYVGEINKNSRN